MFSQPESDNQRAIQLSSLRCTARLIFFLSVIFYMFAVCNSTTCFECSSENDAYCPEQMSSDDEGIIPYLDCLQDKKLYQARYCVKTVGIGGGSLGTRRFCSSRDLGNYCEYIRRPGDQREYRSCVYTCTGDGCNSTGGPNIPNLWFLLAASVLPLLVYFKDFATNGIFPKSTGERLRAR